MKVLRLSQESKNYAEREDDEADEEEVKVKLQHV